MKIIKLFDTSSLVGVLLIPRVKKLFHLLNIDASI